MVKKFFRYLGKHKVILLVLLLIVGIGVYFFKKSGNSSSESVANFYQVQSGDLSVTVNGTGQVYAKKQIDLNAVKAGEAIDVSEVRVENNQEVKEGEILIVIDTRDAQKTVNIAQNSLDSAMVKYEQIKMDSDSLNQEDSLNRLAQEIEIKNKQESLSSAKEDLSDYYIKAPFDGILTGLDVEPGDSIARDDVLASVISKEQYVLISLNELDVASLELGDKAILTFDALPELEIEGEIGKVETIGTVNSGVVSYDVEIYFDNDNELLKPGMSVSADIVLDESLDTLILQEAAISEVKGKSQVKVLKEGVTQDQIENIENFNFLSNLIEVKSVETGISDGVNVEILSGLNVDDVVIVVNKSVISANGSSAEKKSLMDSMRPGGGGDRKGGGMGGGMMMR